MDRTQAISDLRAIQTRQSELSAAVESGQRSATEYREQIERKVTDLERAHRVLTERNYRDPDPVGGSAGEYQLRSYVVSDAPDAPASARSVSGSRGSWEGFSGQRVHLGSYTRSVLLPNGEHAAVVEWGLLDDPNVADPWHLELQKMISLRSLARFAQKMTAHKAGRRAFRGSTPQMDGQIYLHLNKCPNPVLRSALGAHFKAFNDSAGQGAEWIPDTFVPDLYREFQIPRGLRALFPVVEVTGNTILRPRITRGVRPYRKGQIEQDDYRHYTGSTPQTGDATISMEGLAARVAADDAALEDSALVAAQIIRAEVVDALDSGFEDAYINGDTAATHEDAISSWNIRSRWGSGGLGGSADHRTGILGLRARAFDVAASAAVTDLAGTMSVANWQTMRSKLGERGLSSVFGLTSPEALIVDFMTVAQVLTVDVKGPDAVINSGALAQFVGIPLHVSRFVSADLAATGLYTGAGSTTSAIIADSMSLQRYVRRGTTVEVDKDITSGAVNFVATARETLDSPDPAGTANVSLGFNL